MRADVDARTRAGVLAVRRSARFGKPLITYPIASPHFFVSTVLRCGHPRCSGIVGYVAGRFWSARAFIRRVALPGRLGDQLAHHGDIDTVTTIAPHTDKRSGLRTDHLIATESVDYPLRVECPRCGRASITSDPTKEECADRLE